MNDSKGGRRFKLPQASEMLSAGDAVLKTNDVLLVAEIHAHVATQVGDVW